MEFVFVVKDYHNCLATVEFVGSASDTLRAFSIALLGGKKKLANQFSTDEKCANCDHALKRHSVNYPYYCLEVCECERFQALILK